MMDGISSKEGSESMLKVILISKDLIMYSKNDRSIIYIIPNLQRYNSTLDSSFIFK